jgi:rubredoxin-NAD+ reductase
MTEQQEHVCIVCGYIHSEENHGPWEDLSEDYTCPECGVGKQDFELV